MQQELLFVVLSASELLLGVATGLQQSCIGHPNFIPALLDCTLCCSSILTPSPITRHSGKSRLIAASSRVRASHSLGSKSMMKGMENCMFSLEKIISVTPWEITKSWIATVVQHAIVVLSESDFLLEGSKGFVL